jgi:predicted ATPase/DNA-binding CsgD family transcriptional regulator
VTLFEPLTQREYEILTLLEQNLSDHDIAARLFIASTTVKWFNRQIFRKLDVKSRQEAVDRARSLGLLASVEATTDFRQNLPAQLTPFIGRTREVSEVWQWLGHPDVRLVTILAPGGMGKTRLAVEIATLLLDYYADGVYFVPFAGITAPDLFISTIIDTLGFQFPADGRTPKQQLFDALRRKQLLLIMDNLEQILESALQVTQILTAAPQVKILVTSRERLNMTGEVVYPLAGLSTDASDGTFDKLNDAERLFVVCAQRANPHFTPKDLQSIQQLCATVQGMPLAIELAAAWSGILSTAEITAQVSHSVDFLQTSMPNVPERLRSVRIVFETAWARLSDETRQVFRRLSVFRGGCTLEAAQVVTGARIDTLKLLVDRALLWRNPNSERYEIHELLRQYAEQQLSATGEIAQTKHSHQEYYTQLAKTLGEGLLADRQIEALALLDADEKNIWDAFTEAIHHATPQALEPFADLWNYLDLRSRWAEGDKLFLAACNALEPGDSLALAKLLIGRAVFYERLRLWDAELEVATRGYAMTRRLGEAARRALPLAMITYADALRDNGRIDEALLIYNEALPIAETVDSPFFVATLLYHLGYYDALHDRREAAKAKVSKSYRIAVALNNVWGACFCLSFLGIIALQDGELDQAERLFTEAVDRARPVHFGYLLDRVLSGLSSVARERGDWQTTYRISLEILQTRLDVAPGDQILMVLVDLAEAALVLNIRDKACLHISEAAKLLREWIPAAMVVRTIMPETFVRLLVRAAELQTRTGDFPQAVVFLSHAETYLQQCDYYAPSMKRIERLRLQLIDQCRTRLDPQVYQAPAARGSTLSFEDAVHELSLFHATSKIPS